VTNVIALAAILLTTLACQASGWMEAVVAVGTMALVDAGCRLRRGGPIGSVLRPAAMVLLTMVPGLLLFGRFALGGTGPHEIGYGPPPLDRLYSVVVGGSFAPIGRSTAWVGLLLGITLAIMAVSGGIVLRQTDCRQPDRTRSDRDLRLATCMLPLAFLAFLMILPDRAGGGWTHIWRAEPLPYVGLALACAMLPAPRLLQRVAVASATVGSLVSIAMMVWVQGWQVPSAVQEFNEADALIPIAPSRPCSANSNSIRQTAPGYSTIRCFISRTGSS
jgi:hypothetical protein